MQLTFPPCDASSLHVLRHCQEENEDVVHAACGRAWGLQVVDYFQSLGEGLLDLEAHPNACLQAGCRAPLLAAPRPRRLSRRAEHCLPGLPEGHAHGGFFMRAVLERVEVPR